MSNILDLAKQTKELADKATPGPWRSMKDGNQYLGVEMGASFEEAHKHLAGASIVEGLPRAWNPWHVTPPSMLEHVSRFKDGDAEFIAYSRTAAPQLADAVMEMVKVLEQVAQWAGDKTSIIPTQALNHYAKQAAALLTKLEVKP